MNTRAELRHLQERVDSLERLIDLLIEEKYPGMVELATMEGFGKALMEKLKEYPEDERAMTDKELDRAGRLFGWRLRHIGEVPEKWPRILADLMLAAQKMERSNGGR